MAEHIIRQSIADEIVAIPSPPKLPLIGHLLQVPKGKVNQWLLQLSRGFDGIYELQFIGIKLVFVHSAKLAEDIFDQSRFRKVVQPPLLYLRDIGGDGLFTAHDDEPNWAKAHRIMMPAFSKRAVKAYFGAMLEVGQQMMAKWEADAEADRDVVVAADMTRLTLDVIALTGFNYRFNSFSTEKLHPFLDAMVRVKREAINKLTRLPILNHFVNTKPYWADVKLMTDLVDDVIRQRREHPTDTGDLLNLMLSGVDPETSERLDDVNIRYQVITFMIAGHETTSGLLTFALYLLLRHPHVLAQAYAEVDRVLPGDTVPTFEHLNQLDVIERVLKESLRLWPTVPAIPVAPYEDTVIGGRYLIPKDQTVLIPLPALHRDPKVWRDPDRFDIDRFTPEAEAKLPTHAYKPFGNGRRACIGRQFAMTEGKLALALMLQKFALYDPHDYQFKILETMTLKTDGFRIRVRRRQSHERIKFGPEVAGPTAASFSKTPIAPRLNISYPSGASAAIELPFGAQKFTVLENKESARGVARRVTLRFADRMTWKTGDQLGVYRSNQPALVQKTLERLGLNAETVVILSSDAGHAQHLPLGKPVAVGRLLSNFVDLLEPIALGEVRKLVNFTECPFTKRQLEQVAVADGGAPMSLHDVLVRFPAITLPLETFLEFSSPLRPCFVPVSLSTTSNEAVLVVECDEEESRAGNDVHGNTVSTYLSGVVPGDEIVCVLCRPESFQSSVRNIAQKSERGK